MDGLRRLRAQTCACGRLLGHGARGGRLPGRACGHGRARRLARLRRAPVHHEPNPLLEENRAFIEGALAQDHPPEQRHRLLAGRPAQPQEDPGPLVCACFSVGAKTIAAAIGAGCTSVEAIGETLKAGTNCGSCRSEIRRMLHERAPAERKQGRRVAETV